ncbi:MAG: MarR family winged helix-turn-helix transcriptional regulator [Clostridiales bacterium]|nr:MarR family winged helix-turn-helix transcriptional regulator [Clostridiales bacterium]
MIANEIALLRGGQIKYLLGQQMDSLCKKYHLRMADIEVLFYLKNNPEENTASDIQKSLHINKGYVSQIVKGLSEKGYLTVTTDEKDRRYMYYTVTDKTYEITDAHQKIWDTLGARIFKDISPEDREVFDRVTVTVCNNITEMMNEKPYCILDK